MEPKVTGAPPSLNEVARHLQERRRRLDLLLTDGRALRIEEHQRAEDAPRAERHDERRQLEEGHQRAVDPAAGEAATSSPAGKAMQTGKPVDDRQACP